MRIEASDELRQYTDRWVGGIIAQARARRATKTPREQAAHDAEASVALRRLFEEDDEADE